MRPFAEKIERACIAQADSDQTLLVRTAALCLAEVPHCGRVGTTPAELWSSLAGRVLSSLGEALDNAFASVVEGTLAAALLFFLANAYRA
jgi:hypothetical protein